jgi:hypothetical protein
MNETHKVRKINSVTDSEAEPVAGTNIPRQVTRTNAELSLLVEQLRRVNEELQTTHRAALKLIEATIESKDALRETEDRYREKLEKEVLAHTLELE